MKKKNQMSHTNRYILLGLSIFCVLMMVLSSFSDKVGGPFKTVANVTVIPLQQGMNQIGGWMGDMKDNFSTMKQLKSENKKLREQVDALTTENNYLQEERYEFERLQELYKLDQNYAEYEKTAAHVIGKDAGNWFGTFTIDKGSKDGIEVNMNVLAGSGLVGIVTDVGPTWAKVRSHSTSGMNPGICDLNRPVQSLTVSCCQCINCNNNIRIRFRYNPTHDLRTFHSRLPHHSRHDSADHRRVVDSYCIFSIFFYNMPRHG